MYDTPESIEATAARTGAVFRDAFRLLCILVEGSVAATDGECTGGFDRIFYGEKRAQALVFYVCYPDYLADRLLDLYESDQQDVLDEIEKIFAEDEPNVSWTHSSGPMENQNLSSVIMVRN